MGEREELSGRGQEVYEATRRLIRSLNRPVSLDEIAVAADLYDRGAAGTYVRRLEARGYLRRLPGHRGIELAEATGPVLVHGEVSCGMPGRHDDCEPEALDLNRIFGADNLLLVRARGESMRDAGIFPGDVVAVRKVPEADDGSIVLCAIDGEHTLKVLRRSGGTVILHPCNKRARRIPLSPDNENIVIGVYAGIVRLPK
jgi:repressor LexA